MSEVRIRDKELVHEVTLPVLGVPVRVRSNAAEIIDAFESALGGWRVIEGRADLLSSARIEGRLILHSGDEGGQAHPPVRHRMVGKGRLIYMSPGSVCMGDGPGREFTGWVTRELLSDRDHFRYNLLESVVFWVVTNGGLDRQPVHASAVVRNGTALLLTGPSGTGKSTLTYAAARAGLEVLTDDVIFGQLHPLRIWGMPNFLHLPADARRHFPELGDHHSQLLANGKEKIAVSLAGIGAAARFPLAERTGVCVLERGAAATEWAHLPPPVLEEAMLAQLEGGFDLFKDTVGELLRALAMRGGWRLRIGRHPEEAVGALHQLLDQVDGREPNAP